MNLSNCKGEEYYYIELLWNNNKKREQTHPMCLHTVEKYQKVESINTQNDYKTTSKKMNRWKENRLVLCVL